MKIIDVYQSIERHHLDVLIEFEQNQSFVDELELHVHSHKKYLFTRLFLHRDEEELEFMEEEIYMNEETYLLAEKIWEQSKHLLREKGLLTR